MILEMLDFDLIKIITTVAASMALLFALLYHYWSLEDDDE